MIAPIMDGSVAVDGRISKEGRDASAGNAGCAHDRRSVVVDGLEAAVTVEELIEWLQRLPKEAMRKPIIYQANVDGDDLTCDIDTVDYDLRVVTLR